MKLLFELARITTTITLAAYLSIGLAGQESPAPAPASDPAVAGAPLYQLYCAACHGASLTPAESVFDLRDLAPSDKRRFVNSVARGKDSMPAWGALLTPQQIEAVWDYVMSRKTGPASAAPAAAAPDPAATSTSQAWPCGGDAKLLVDSAGGPVWIGSDELKSHAIGTPSPVSSAGTSPASPLALDVLIDSQGRVRCTRAAPGPTATPDASPAALDAIRRWAFRPFAAGGQPVAVYGHLQLDLETR